MPVPNIPILLNFHLPHNHCHPCHAIRREIFTLDCTSTIPKPLSPTNEWFEAKTVE
jgi:hypothetical protein